MSLFDDFIDEDPEDEDIEQEEIPEGQGFGHPRITEFSFGHEDNERRLLELYNSKRMPQAVVFSGPEGIGKATTAYRLARFLLSQPADDTDQGGLFGAPEEKSAPTSLDIPRDHPIFRQAAGGAHPDLLAIERAFDENKNRYKENVDVESVRKVAPFLRMTSSGGGWRVVIIDDADTMNRNAQNALLKILEEPPPKVLIILIAHRTGALIPTIYSRVHSFDFRPLNTDTLMQVLQKNMPHITREQAVFLGSFSHGSLGNTLNAMEQDVFTVFESLMKIWKTWPRWDGIEIHALGDDLASNGREAAYGMFKQLLGWVLFSLARAKARGKALEAPLNHLSFMAFAANSSLEEILKICENLESHFDKVETANLDKRQGVLGAFSLIAP